MASIGLCGTPSLPGFWKPLRDEDPYRLNDVFGSDRRRRCPLEGFLAAAAAQGLHVMMAWWSINLA